MPSSQKLKKLLGNRAMKYVEWISEYSTLSIRNYTLSSDEREYLTRLAKTDTGLARFTFDELKSELRFTSSSWVGVVELRDVIIIICPKFNNKFRALTDMVCFVEGLPFYSHEDVSGREQDLAFDELLAALFLSEVDKLLQTGIVREYLAEEDSLRQLRGRPDIIMNIRKNLARPTQIYCHFQELEANIPENQVILSALEITCGFRVQKGTRQKAGALRHEFYQFCRAYSGVEWPTFTYHRLNAHYRPAHSLAWYIFQQKFTNDLLHFGHKGFYSLLVDMNDLFEKFVFTYLKRFLPRGCQVEYSRRINNAIVAEGKSYRHIIPDIIINIPGANCALAVDAKYKPYGDNLIATGDIFQLSFYAQYLRGNEEELPRSFIFYPKYKDSLTEDTRVINLLPGRRAESILSAVSVDIEELLELVKSKDWRELSEKASFMLDLNA